LIRHQRFDLRNKRTRRLYRWLGRPFNPNFRPLPIHHAAES
jgi:hypothetical protein